MAEDLFIEIVPIGFKICTFNCWWYGFARCWKGQVSFICMVIGSFFRI